MLSLTLALSERRKAGAIVTLHGGGHRDKGQWGWQPDTHPALTAPQAPTGPPALAGRRVGVSGTGGHGGAVPILDLFGSLASAEEEEEETKKQIREQRQEPARCSVTGPPTPVP